ncbi:MAG: hypothetical protein JSV88_17805 [Candidatus Aminicenantes bacterium]|nr:MAG: hypothetical protein JSV88_17805 [Candidatus Aminicenantes bacterium]
MKKIGFTVVLTLLLLFLMPARGIFEEAVGKGEGQTLSFQLNGYVRSALFLGRDFQKKGAEIKSGYAETSLKLRVKKQHLGDLFAEIRFRKGSENGEALSETYLREAYVNAYIGPFDLRVGQQVVVWGRADGFNPTDNITPKNLFARSAEDDDKRESNFLFRSFINLHPVVIEAIWVPFFKESPIPTTLFPLPPGITFAEPEFPGAKLRHSTAAVKFILEAASFDCSISYFNGFSPFPGIDASSTAIFLRAYRMHVVGLDFSTTMAGTLGLRGEMAYKKPLENNSENNLYIPLPEFRYVIGVDREFFGKLSVILQYIGSYIFDFTELTEPKDPTDIPGYELARKNRLLHSQQYKITHSISCTGELSLLHEILKLEVSGLFNLISEELFLRSRMTYKIADAFNLTLGMDLYKGPDDTLFGLMDPHLSTVYAELKASF